VDPSDSETPSKNEPEPTTTPKPAIDPPKHVLTHPKSIEFLTSDGVSFQDSTHRMVVVLSSLTTRFGGKVLLSCRIKNESDTVLTVKDLVIMYTLPTSERPLLTWPFGVGNSEVITIDPHFEASINRVSIDSLREWRDESLNLGGTLHFRSPIAA